MIMEFKYYDKSWLPAIKGALLIIFGIIAMLKIVGSIGNLASFFILLIGLIAVLLLSSGILFKKSRFRIWTIVCGAINLVFCLLLAIKVETSREQIGWILMSWVIFQAITEIVEAGLLISLKNAFAALFLLNGLLTFLFGYFLWALMHEFSAERVFYVGVVATVFGLANVLSAYMLNIIRKEAN